jgi:tetratricopeptide (TPR) repeat protein
LARSAGDDCRQGLDKAQSILDGVAANPAFVVALPGGRAREENTEYRIHLARASCGGNPPSRDSELREALGAAQRAVELYRDALDYGSAAISQFNAASTHRLLGDDARSIASLEIAIDLDREYGFRQDAEDNNQLLMRWKAGDGAAAGSAAGRMQEFPRRSVALKFGRAPALGRDPSADTRSGARRRDRRAVVEAARPRDRCRVTDPNTLMTYASAARRYWYLSVGSGDPNGAITASESIVSTFMYH